MEGGNQLLKSSNPFNTLDKCFPDREMITNRKQTLVAFVQVRKKATTSLTLILVDKGGMDGGGECLYRAFVLLIKIHCIDIGVKNRVKINHLDF